MPELDPVTQEITADASEWLSTLDAMIAKAEQFLALASQMDSRLVAMAEAAVVAGEGLAAAADQAERLADVNAQAAAAVSSAASSLGDVSVSAAEAAAANGVANDSFLELGRAAAYLSGTFGMAVESENVVAASSARLGVMNQGLADSFHNVTSAATVASLSEAQLAGMNERLGLSSASAAAMYSSLTDAILAGQLKMAAATAAGAGGGAAATGWLATSIAWWQRWSAVIHWAVMGTMEILSTAIPAIIAFGAGLAAMYPAADQLKDHFTNLITASGSLSNAVSSMNGPMGALGRTMGQLGIAAAPNVWEILGSAISIVTRNTGVFSQIALQASNVLGSFAAKIVTDLQGPAGKALDTFFQNGVQFMIQWGQVLGNFGSAFLNIFHAMPGIGHVLLGALDGIAQALNALTKIPFVAWILGAIAAMSGLYRYTILITRAAQFLWAVFLAPVWSALVTGATAAAMAFLVLRDAMVLTEETGFAAKMQALGQGLMTAFPQLGLLGSAFLSLGGILLAGGVVAGIDILVGKLTYTKTATEQLISSVLQAPPTVQNLSNGMTILSGALIGNARAQQQVNQQVAITNTQAARQGVASAATATTTNELSTALQTEYNRLKQVEQGLTALGYTNGQTAADMNVMSISIGMQDSQVSKLNQAWDSYLQLVTGGMSSLANLTTALGNMTTVTSTSGLTNLQQQVSQLTLTAPQFQAALQSGAVQGASAWQNFTQVMTGSLGPLADYLQQALTAGVITKTQFAQGIAAATAEMIPYTGTTGTAADMLLAFYRRSGDASSSLAQVQQATGGVNSATQQLNGLMNTAAIQMSNASGVAQNLSAVFQTQVTNAMVAAALKASTFNTDVANMMQAQKTGLDVNGHNWQYWAQQAALAWQNAQNAATTGTNTILADQARIPNNVTKTLTYVVQGYGAPPGGYSVSYGPGIYHGAAPPGGATGGLVHGPGTGTSDSVPAWLSRGEYVMKADAVAHYGLRAMESLNARRLAGGGSITPGLGASVLEATLSGGGGTTHLHNTSRVNVSVGGRQVMTEVQRQSAIYTRRNPATGLNLRARTGTPR